VNLYSSSPCFLLSFIISILTPDDEASVLSFLLPTLCQYHQCLLLSSL
jgi:hypothetical protein